MKWHPTTSVREFQCWSGCFLCLTAGLSSLWSICHDAYLPLNLNLLFPVLLPLLAIHGLSGQLTQNAPPSTALSCSAVCVQKWTFSSRIRGTKKKKHLLVLTGHLYRSLSRCQPRPYLQEDCHWSGEGTTASPSQGLEGRTARRSPGPRRNEALKNIKSRLFRKRRFLKVSSSAICVNAGSPCMQRAMMDSSIRGQLTVGGVRSSDYIYVIICCSSKKKASCTENVPSNVNVYVAQK